MFKCDELVSGFNPAKYLQEAMAKIANGEALSFNNEYAVETLWHEIVHGITGIAPLRYPIGIEPLAEGVVQWVARHSYQALMNVLGGQVTHQESIIKNGLSYPQVTGNLLILLARAELDAGQLTGDLLKDASNWKGFLTTVLADKMALKPKDINAILNYSERLMRSDFTAKLNVKITNARRNRGVP